MQKNVTGLNKEEVIFLHHQALHKTFFDEINMSSQYIEVTSNVENDKTWDYVMPLSSVGFNFDNQNIYTPDFINSNNHELIFQDSWMAAFVTPQEKPVSLSDLTIAEVKSDKEMNIFLDGFFQAYSGYDEHDPYGALPETYRAALWSSFKNTQAKLNFFYFMQRGDLVAVSAIANIDNYSFLYCIGVTPQFRGKGFYKHILQHSNYFSHNNSCKFLVLQTAKDSFVEKINLKNNFIIIDTINYFKSKR